MIHTIEYENQMLAVVEVNDSELAKLAIKEMVEFFGMREVRLDDNEGNYLQTWLKQLGAHIATYGEPPDTNEGWYRLDASKGITLLEWGEYQFEDSGFEVKTGT